MLKLLEKFVNCYNSYLDKLKHYSLPYANLPIGKMLQYAGQQIKKLTTVKHKELF